MQESPEVFTYEISKKLKNQIIFIIRDSVGSLIDNHYSSSYTPENTHRSVHDALCREYGKDKIGSYDGQYEFRLTSYFLNLSDDHSDTERALDLIELYFQLISNGVNNEYQYYIRYNPMKLTINEAIIELNERFKENSIGYQFESGQIVRIDSTFVHQEITIPTLTLLRNIKFAGANEEYLKSHEHYRNGRNKECLTECAKAFESTMKIICKEKGWLYSERDTAKKLIEICFKNGLVPTFSQNQFTSLQNLLESGIPTIRNKVGGHGQGPIPQSVDDGLTRYGMNLTGSNIIFLVEQSGL